MSDRDFEINGKKFKLSKIDGLAQFHIVRRIGPILSELIPAVRDAMKGPQKSASEEEKLDKMSKLLGPFMMGMSKLSDKDSEKVLFSLLSAVEIQQEQGNWAKLASPEMLMFQDLDFKIMMNSAARAFGYNLASFF